MRAGRVSAGRLFRFFVHGVSRTSRLVAALAAILVGISVPEISSAQYVPAGCPGRWISQGGGMACLCPNGTLAYGWPNIRCGGVGARRRSGIPRGSDHCGGNRYCKPGLKCASGGKCLPKDADDCGGGKYCANGLVCIGTDKCGTQEQAEQIRKLEEMKKAAEEAEKKRAAAEAKFHADAPERKKVSDILKEGLEKKRIEDLKKSADARQQELHAFMAEYGPRSANCQLVEMGWGAAEGKACALKELNVALPVTGALPPAPNRPNKAQKRREVAPSGPVAGQAPAPIPRDQLDHLRRNIVSLQPERRTIQPVERPNELATPRATLTFATPITLPGVPQTTSPTKSRDELWPVMGVPGSGPVLPPNEDKVAHDWPALEMANAAYYNDLKPGSPVFKGNPDWIVLEKHGDEKTGFLAYTFVNEREKRAVVAVQGSRNPLWLLDDKGVTQAGRDAQKDWQQDIAAVSLGKTPAQFTQARQYVQEVSDRLGSSYVVDCAGHSLGGGSCVYAAAHLDNVHAIAVTPVSSNALVTENAYRIDNYVTARDATELAHSATERGLTGWKYEVQGDDLGSTPGIQRWTQHDLDRILDALSKQTGLKRYEVVR